ncbi:MAG TPA: hypothetical protein VFQ27_08710 [Xanthobacteraceae bacterium]|nr:hypothetical protein [Xanthobacteraceae bacterium]
MPFAIPPALALMLGFVGSVALVRWVAKEARRINDTLHPWRADAAGDAEFIIKLKRDPVSGVYRPE